MAVLGQSPDTWGVPVRVVSQPSGSWWIPTINLVIGLLLGLFFEPIRERVVELFRRRRANFELYDELGAYLARFAGFKLREEARVKPSGRFDIELWQELTRPYMAYFDHFSAREQSVFLRMDNPRGIHNLVQRLRMVGNVYRPADAFPYAHPDSQVIRAFCFDVEAAYTEFANSKGSSRQRIAAAFNRHRETKTAPFPIRAKEGSGAANS